MDYRFSLAVKGDMAEIMALYRGLMGTPGCTWSEHYPTEEIVAADIAEDSLYVLRDHTGRIIAVAAAGVSDELEELSWSLSNPCDLARIGVSPEMQGRGVGTIILRHVMEAAGERGFDGIRMLVSKSNPTALALYDKNGFHRCGDTRMYGIDFYCYELVF